MISIRLSDLEGPIADRMVVALADENVRGPSLKRIGREMRSWLRRSIKLAKRNADGTYNKSRPGGLPRYRNRVARGFLRDGSPRIVKFSKSNHPFVGSKFMVYRYDGASQSVVVGPRALGSNATMPRNLEFGGTRTVNPRIYTKASHRQVGEFAEIRIGGKESKTTRNERFTNRGDVDVTYTRIKTGRQAGRANRLNRLLYHKPGTPPPRPGNRRTVSTRARPYIRPAYRHFIDSGKASEIISQFAMASIAGKRRRR